MPTAAVKAYWDWLPDQCLCGAPAKHPHHIIHLNGQRITKDDWLIVKLCDACHVNDDASVHRLGGEAQFLERTGWDLVHWAVLNRHNYEVWAR
jgi:hypothetical protein